MILDETRIFLHLQVRIDSFETHNPYFFVIRFVMFFEDSYYSLETGISNIIVNFL